MSYKYKFAIPAYITFCIDESNVSLESIKDLKKLQKKYSIDLQYVIDEYEYKMETEHELEDEDDDYIALNSIEVFDSVIEDLWNEISESFKVNVKLDEINQDDILKIYEATSNNFNSIEKWNNSLISNIKMIDVDDKNSQFIVEIETYDKITDEQIELIRKYLDNQCSDGWGESFENEDLSHLIDEERNVYVKTWEPKSEVKFIK